MVGQSFCKGKKITLFSSFGMPYTSEWPMLGATAMIQAVDAVHAPVRSLQQQLISLGQILPCLC